MFKNHPKINIKNENRKKKWNEKNRFSFPNKSHDNLHVPTCEFDDWACLPFALTIRAF
jgi:hypothetical protein